MRPRALETLSANRETRSRVVMDRRYGTFPAQTVGKEVNFVKWFCESERSEQSD